MQGYNKEKKAQKCGIEWGEPEKNDKKPVRWAMRDQQNKVCEEKWF